MPIKELYFFRRAGMAISEMEWCAFALGYRFHIIQRHFGMRHSSDGVAYYAEVHKSVWNAYIHTAFMPLTMLGFYIAIPALFRLNYRAAHALRRISMAFYFGIYIRISPLIAGLFILYYAIPMYYATEFTRLMRIRHFGPKLEVAIGLGISIIALLFQEVLGHYTGGDDPSRIEAVPNAMVYAPYFSVSHMF